MFRVGQKVVCVDARHTYTLGGRRRSDEIVEGEVYTIRWTDGSDVRLVEETLRDRYGDDGPFRASRFRPVVERKTDISVFHAMLNPTPEKVLDDQRSLTCSNSVRESV